MTRGRLPGLLAVLTLTLVALAFREIYFRTPAPAASVPSEAALLVGRAVEQRRQGDLLGAAATLKQAIAAHPDWPEAHLQLGIVYTEAREYALAREEMQRVTRDQPQAAVGWAQLARLGLLTQQLNESEVAARKAVRLAPDRAAYATLLGEVLRRRGNEAQLRESVEQFHRALDLDPGDAGAFHHLGLAYQGLGKYDEAAGALARAAMLTPEEPALYSSLAQVERARGRKEAARKALEVFKRLQAGKPSGETSAASSPSPQPASPAAVSRPSPAAALVSEGRRLVYDQAQPDAALELFQQARKLDPADPSAPYNLGLTLHFVGRDAEAEEAFRAAAALDARNPRYPAWLGTLRLQRGGSSAREALELLRQAVSLGPDYAYGHYQLGRALLQTGTAAEAVPLLERAVRLDARYKEAWYGLAQAYRGAGREEEARRATARFRKLDDEARERRRLRTRARSHPDDPQPRLEVARDCLAHGDWREALRWLEDLRRTHPQNAPARQLEARIRREHPGEDRGPAADEPRGAPG